MNPTFNLVRVVNQRELTAAETLTTLCCSSQTRSPPAVLPAVQAPIIVMPVYTLSIPSVHAMPPTRKINNDEVKKNFPQKLLEILETPEHSNILKWLPGGKAFIIIDKKGFISNVQLPVFLKHTQFTSFTRKLFRWKFARVSRGPFAGAYYHKLFKRDHPALCKLMSCNKHAPSLALITQTKQQAMESISICRRPMMVFSVSQQNPSQILEEANRVCMLKEQLLNIRLKRAHLYKQQKKIRRQAEASRTVLGPHARQQPLPNQIPYCAEQIQLHRTQFHMNGTSPSNSSRILQDAYRVLKIDKAIEHNAQTGMLDHVAVKRFVREKT